jgi:hypothetical protein
MPAVVFACLSHQAFTSFALARLSAARRMIWRFERVHRAASCA